MKTKLNLPVALIVLAGLAGVQQAAAQGTAFNYKGKLNANGGAANGLYDFRFTLYSDALGTTQAARSRLIDGVGVANGFFTTTLDFGAGIFTGSNYWMEVEVRTNNPANTLGYTTLDPLQPVLPAPYAIYSATAGSATTARVATTAGSANSVSAANITGTVPLAQLPGTVLTNNERGVTLGGTFSGNGAGLTNLNSGIPGATSAVAPFTVPPKIPVSAIGSVTTGESPYCVAVAGRYAYVVTYNGGTLQVFDVSTPATPVLVGSVSTGTESGPKSVTVAGRYAYVTDYGDDGHNLQIFDVSNPSAPVSVGLVAAGYAEDTVVAGRYAYVASDNYPLQVFDVGNPSAPVALGSAGTGGGSAIAVSGRYAYEVNNNGPDLLQVIDVGNPSAPRIVGSVGTRAYPLLVAVSGSHAYVVTGDSSRARTLLVVDVSNPTSPVITGTAGLGSGGLSSLSVAGRYAYMTTYDDNSMLIIDVSDPTAPVTVGSVGTDGISISAAVSGRYAYVANYGGNTLQVFDLGGTYIQQMEAGTIETGTLQTRDTVTVGNNLDVRGGLTVSASARISGGLSADNVTAVTLTQTSDRNAKEDFTAVNANDILQKVAALPITEWSFKTDAGARHLGPMAQDFRTAFNLGLDDKHIATVDEEGVALAAIQGLNRKVEEKETKIEQQAGEIADLKARLEKVEQRMQAAPPPGR